MLVVLAASAPAEAAKKPITGKLSERGYTVIALGASGKAKAVRANPKFKLRPLARRVTLHLRARDGTYAGPVVIGKKRHGRLAILGVEAGARLGNVKVNQRKGYAKVTRLAKRFVDGKREARAKKGVPIGAGNFGRVRSKDTHGGAPGDPDLDGVPDPLDIDDDGDLVLDDNDRSGAARASQAENEFHVFPRLTVPLDATTNANAGALTEQQADATLVSYGDLLISILGDSAELDCGDALTGLIYCRPGGTGTTFEPGVPNGQPFPDCCDPDGDGFGMLTPDAGSQSISPPFGAMTLHTRATTAQMGTGDVLIQRVTTGGVETDFTSTQQYVFATAPALHAFTDSAGNSTTISYPVTPPDPGTGMGGGPGTRETPIPVEGGPCPPSGPPACVDGDVVLTLTYWRPQRTRISGDPEPQSGESDKWTDIGGLVFTAQLADIGFRCPQTTLSESDPNLEPPGSSSLPAFSNDQGGFLDQAPDQSANPANTFTYTVDLTQCLAADGLTFNPGEKRGFETEGISPNFGGVTIGQIFFKRQ